MCVGCICDSKVCLVVLYMCFIVLFRIIEEDGIIVDGEGFLEFGFIILLEVICDGILVYI